MRCVADMSFMVRVLDDKNEVIDLFVTERTVAIDTTYVSGIESIVESMTTELGEEISENAKTVLKQAPFRSR